MSDILAIMLYEALEKDMKSGRLTNVHFKRIYWSCKKQLKQIKEWQI